MFKQLSKFLVMEEANLDGAASVGAAADLENQSSSGEGGTASGGAEDNGRQQGNILNNDNGDDKKITSPAKFPDDWRDQLAGGDDKFRKQLERYQSPESLAKAYRELQAKLSSGEYKSTTLPENPTDQEISAWRKENNVPEKIDDYLNDLPSGIVIGDDDKERVNSFLESMLGKNVPKEYVQSAIEWNQQMIEQEMVARHERNQTAQAQAEDSLRQEWGPEYRRNINLINGMLDSLPKEAKNSFINAQTPDGVSIFNNPLVAKWMVDLARAANPVATVVPGANNPQAITEEIATLEKRMKDDYPGWFKDSKAQDRLRELYSAQEKLGL